MFPFAQWVEYKILFVFDPVDGMINQFIDIENKRLGEIDVAGFGCHERKRPPNKSLKILAAR